MKFSATLNRYMASTYTRNLALGLLISARHRLSLRHC